MTPETRATLERCIAFDTVSRNSNLGMIEWMGDRLRALGIPVTLVRDSSGTKANLWATIGPEVDGGIILSGHTDVVPVDGQAWTTDPFTATERDGKIFGRGTCDMKGFIATCLALAPTWAKLPLVRPIHFAFSYDEEVGCIGVRSLIDLLATLPFRPAGCVVGEPTEMQMVLGHKGKRAWCCTVEGRAAHSSAAPSGINAIEGAATLIGHIADLAAELRANDGPDAGFDIPFSTMLTTMIDGGIAMNTVPDTCRFIFECRHLPGTDPEALFGRIRDFAETRVTPTLKAGSAVGRVRFEEVLSYPGLDAPQEGAFTQRVSRLTCASVPPKVAFGTEAGLFQAAGIQTIVCGPGSIAQAHRPDEFCTIDQLTACENFLNQLVAGQALP